MKKSIHSIQGGGANYSSLDKSTSVFKPLIASSLALALGVSVASANPTIQYGTSGVTSNNTIQSGQAIAVDGATWTQDASNGNLLKPTASGTTIDTINLVFDKTDTTTATADISGSDLTITTAGKITATRQPTIQISSNQGIMLGDNGSGTLSVDFESARYATNDGAKTRFAILDLSGVSSGVAYKGSIEIGTGSATVGDGWQNENQFIAKFGGSGMQGNITINSTGDGDGLKTMFYLGNGADINGTITLNASGASKNFITYNQANKTINTSLDLRSGALTYQFDTSITNLNDKVFTLDTSADKIEVSGGKLIFDNVKQVIFKNGSSDTNGGQGTLTTAPKIVDNKTYQDGLVSFYFDNAIVSNTSNPIIKGNISATNGSVVFALKDTSSVTGSNPFTNSTASQPTKIYYIDGSLSTNNGGISAFWDDEKGFYAKISTVNGVGFQTSGGLVGKNDLWFQASPTGLTTIQATSGGISHLVFDQAITISGATAIKAQGSNSTQILFKGDATITGGIYVESQATNTLTANALTFEGAISASGAGINTITATSGTATIAGISTKDWTFSSSMGNTINLGSGSITINERTGDTDANINDKAIYAKNGKNKNDITANIIKVNGEIFAESEATNSLNATSSITITGNIGATGSGNNLIDTASLTIAGNITTNSGRNEITGASSLTGDITASGGGANIISELTSATDTDITASWGGTNTITSTANSLTFSSIQIGQGHTHNYDTAKNTINFSGTSLTISNGISTAGYFGGTGTNEINLKTANAQLIISDKGITARQLNGTWDLTYTQENNITFEKGGTLTLNGSGATTVDTGFDFGGILARDGEQNNITFESNNNATINVPNSLILADGGYNTITFKGSGTNTINSSIVAQGKKNEITSDYSLTISGSSYILSASGSGVNAITATSGSVTFAGISTKGWVDADVGNTINLGSGSVTINARSGDADANINNKAIYANGARNTNNITAGTVTVNGGMYATEQSTNSLTATTTLNFSGAISASNGGINTITAIGGTATIAGISTNVYVSNSVGNTINLGSGSVTINARSGETVNTDINGKALYAKNGNNSNNITAGTIIINGEMYADTQGINSLTASSAITVNGNITIADFANSTHAQNNFTLTANGATLTLNGLASGGTTHNITSLTASTSGSNTLTLDNSAVTDGAMETTIHSIINGDKLTVKLNGRADNGVNLILDNTTGTTITSVTLGASAVENTLTFKAGSNQIQSAISVGNAQDLSIALGGANTSLNLVSFSKGSGEANINVIDGANATLRGGAIDTTKLSFAGTSALTINNSSASLGEIYISNGASATLKGNEVSASTLRFAGASTFNLANQGATITSINVDSGSSTLQGIAINGSNLTFANNTALTLQNAGDTFATVDASNATTNGATLTIGGGSNAINATINTLKGGTNLSVAFNEATLKIKGVDATSNNILTLANVSMETNSKNNTLDLSELSDTVTSVNFGSAIAVGGADNTQGLSINVKGLNSNNTRAISFTNGTTITNGALNLTILDGNATLSATANSINLSNLSISSAGTAPTVTFESDTTIGNLTAQANGNLVVGKASATTTLSIGTTNSTLDSVTLAGDSATLEINGGTLTINALSTNATTNNLVLNSSTLSLSSSSTVSTLTTDGNSTINLAVGHNGTNKATQAPSNARNTLTIGNLNGDLSANIFVSKAQADQIAITNANADTTLTLYARGKASEIISIAREDNVLVADTSGGSAKSNVEVIGGTSDLGGLVVKLNVNQEQDQNGDYTGKWYVGKTEVKGVDTSFQEVASSALAVNYDLFLANFNSLNKRMGELRDNPYNQGVWARVFGGAMSNDIGSGSKSEYVTAQAGYDYSLTLGDARNYMGIAVAYGSSWSKANEGVGLTNATLDNIDSKMVEVGIYNSYVMDSGWYNDTIFKFDYIMSDFDISVASGGTSSHSTNNFAMVLSDEFGYRYKFAESEKGNWYIDPQVELAFGYFNQSDFNQEIAGGFTTVDASQDAILTLRTRAGLSLGKKFNTTKGFASVYVGAFYEYDYIEGGNAEAQTLGIANTLDGLESNGRAIVNIGSNIELTDGVRMYIDVEKSFGDKQRTDMQFNFGARYSFGEKNPTLSTQEAQKPSVAPLKIEEKK